MRRLKLLEPSCRLRHSVFWAMLTLAFCPPSASAADWKGTRGRRDSDARIAPAPPPPPPPPPGSIAHGYDVNAQNVGLTGVGLSAASLTKVSGGDASKLANATDPETGWPMLYRLDIDGQVTADTDCVISQCRITKTGLLYAVHDSKNRQSYRYIIRDSNIIGKVDETGEPPRSMMLMPWKVQRCIVKGGSDSIKFGGPQGCLIEDSYVYEQQRYGAIHIDAMQMQSGTATVRRCRIEGPWKEHNSAIIIRPGSGDITGVTIEDCFLSGGNFTLYTRDHTNGDISNLRIRGNLWAEGSAVYGLWSRDVAPTEFENNAFAPVINGGASPVEVDLSKRTPMTFSGG